MGEYLALIVDASPCRWGAICGGGESPERQSSAASRCVSALSAFAAAYTLQDAAHTLLVVAAAKSAGAKVLFASGDTTCAQAAEALSGALMRVVSAEAAEGDDACDCPPAPALSAVLCRMNRARNEAKSAAAAGDTKPPCRALFVRLSPCAADQHLSLMNLFFAAQKQSVDIDAVMLRTDCALMQQACDITGGIYTRVDELDHLLQILMATYLPSCPSRSSLSRPPCSDVDCRPVCVCHGKFVSDAWVCSVCLAVLCAITPICPICQTVFRMAPLFAAGRKKRQKASASSGAPPTKKAAV